MLIGPSGAGKTRLALEAVRRAMPLDVEVVSGACEPVDLEDVHAASARAGALHPFRPLLRLVADRCVAEGPETSARLVGALGPAGFSLYDLIDATTLSQMLGAGDCGALIVLCRGELCSLGSPSGQMPLELEKATPFLRDLLRGGLLWGVIPLTLFSNFLAILTYSLDCTKFIRFSIKCWMTSSIPSDILA